MTENILGHCLPAEPTDNILMENYVPAEGNCCANWDVDYSGGSNYWFFLFLALLTASDWTKWYLHRRQRNLCRDDQTIPEELARRLPSWYTEEMIKKNWAHQVKMQDYYMLKCIYMWAFWMVIWSFKVPAKAWHWIQTLGICAAQNELGTRNIELINDIWQMLIMSALMQATDKVLMLPLSFYFQFIVNKATTRLSKCSWILSHIKQLILSTISISLTIAMILWLIDVAEGSFTLLIVLVITGVFVLNILLPILIKPFTVNSMPLIHSW